MRAWRVDGVGEPADVLALENDVALPPLSAGMIRIAVGAAGVGLPDVYMCRGSYPLTPTRPFTPGQELVGTVLEAPEGSTVAVGSRVMAVSAFFLGCGSFAEECLALDDFALPVPDGMSDAEAAGFLIPYHTAWVGLVRRGKLQAGEDLLVLGASGGTGSTAVQLGKALGARVIAVAGGEEKVAFCRELGADVVIDRRAGDISEAVRAATGGKGADIVYDPVGGDAYAAAAKALAFEGRIVLIGFASGDWGRPSAPALVNGNQTVIGAMPNGYDRAFKEDVHGKMLDLWSDGRIRVPLHTTIPFAQVPDAVGILAQGEVVGKVTVAVAA